MLKRTHLSALTLLLFFTVQATAQLNSEGTRFWMAYMENITLQFNGEPTFGFWVYSDGPVTGTMTVPQTGLTVPFEGSGGALEVILPEAIWYNENSQVITNKGILIETDIPVNVSGIHYRTYFSDGSRLISEDLLGSDYLVLAGVDQNGGSFSAMTIVATEDQTEIEIIPSTLTTELFPGGTPFTITMDEGQSYQIKATGDLTGTTVTAIGGEKIAVFTGAQQAAVGCTGEDSHLWEQMPPLSFTGLEFPLIPYLSQGTCEYKVLATEDDTDIYLSCDDIVTLNAGETFNYSLNTPEILKATKGVFIGHFNRSSDCNATDAGPSFAILNPLKNQSTGQSLLNSDLVGPITQFFSDYSINFVALAGTESGVNLNGNMVSFSPIPGNSNWVYASVAMPAGTSSFTAPDGVWVQTASFGDFDACTYALGFNVEVIPDNDIALTAEPNPTTNSFCAGNQIPFSYESDGILTNILWDFAGLGTSMEETPIFTFTEPGTYEVLFTAELDGCPVSASIVVEVEQCDIVSVQELTSSIQLSYSAAGEIIISGNTSTIHLQVYAANGQLVIDQTNVDQRVRLDDLASGMYVVQVSSGNQTERLKVFR
ncbi:T9SS type A sorting domain-containing protein [Sanyastnella coralliicola]|uniref:T9SS type A sorting domain-containing protein n=1 Tax=Sanyastnella coralliicola TaxID=3069118 RepID=UPI0027B96234|nr:T9SS type A sorting domain-containing protein [Longitalea sp. SCSIO 12813]